MRTMVTFLMTVVTILLVSGYATGSALIPNDLPQGFVAPLALLCTLGLVRRARRLLRNQAI